MLDHGVGTVFGETAEIGDDCYVKLATMYSLALIARWLKTLSRGARYCCAAPCRSPRRIAFLVCTIYPHNPCPSSLIMKFVKVDGARFEFSIDAGKERISCVFPHTRSELLLITSNSTGRPL